MLEAVYEHVRRYTLRGRLLTQAPLVLIGVATDQTSHATSADLSEYGIEHVIVQRTDTSTV